MKFSRIVVCAAMVAWGAIPMQAQTITLTVNIEGVVVFRVPGHTGAQARALTFMVAVPKDSVDMVPLIVSCVGYRAPARCSFNLSQLQLSEDVTQRSFVITTTTTDFWLMLDTHCEAVSPSCLM